MPSKKYFSHPVRYPFTTRCVYVVQVLKKTETSVKIKMISPVDMMRQPGKPPIKEVTGTISKEEYQKAIESLTQGSQPNYQGSSTFEKLFENLALDKILLQETLKIFENLPRDDQSKISPTNGGIDLNPTIAQTSIKKADGGIDFGKVDEAMAAQLGDARGFSVNILQVTHAKSVLPLIGLGK